MDMHPSEGKLQAKFLGISGLMIASAAAAKTSSPLAAAVGGLRSAFFAVAGLSGCLNVLTLTGSFVMLLVYDRM